jgi:hypothetical protein
MRFAKVLLSSLAPAVVVVSLGAIPRVAAANDGGLPGGSWRQTCQNAQVRQGVLYTDCRRVDGRYSAASAQIASCQAFGNRDGRLFCESQENGSYSRNQWGGSFHGSCRDVSTDTYGTLLATCQAAKGDWRQSRLSARDCASYRAGNRDGQLFCESRGDSSHAGNQWQGSFRDSCREIAVDRYGQLTAKCRKDNAKYKYTKLSPEKCSSRRAGTHNGNLFCESRDERAGGNWHQWDGSFRNSCRDVSIESDGDLTATCQGVNGGWRQARLSARDCASYRAGNRDGQLFCEARDERAASTPNQWSGSFRQSCRDVSIESDGDLIATCQGVNGGWRQARLSPQNCDTQRAGNRDGELLCER